MAAPLPLTPNTDDWPRLGDGRIGWDRVFEAKNGLIAQLNKASDAVSLRRAARLIVRQLFRRREDAAVRYRYLARIDTLTGDDAEAPGDRQRPLAEMLDDVIWLLRAVKTHRLDAAKTASLAQSERGPQAFPGLDRTTSS